MRRENRFEAWDEDDEGGWDEEGLDDDDEGITIPCPACGADIYEDAPQCPVCGEYVVQAGGRVWDGKPVWYVLLGLLGIVSVIIVLLFIS